MWDNPHADISNVVPPTFENVLTSNGSGQDCTAPLEDGLVLCKRATAATGDTRTASMGDTTTPFNYRSAHPGEVEPIYRHMICKLNTCNCPGGYPHGAYVTNGVRGREECVIDGKLACSGCHDGYVMTGGHGTVLETTTDFAVATCIPESAPQWTVGTGDATGTSGAPGSTFGGRQFCKVGFA